jgi:hypothetical protein
MDLNQFCRILDELEPGMSIVVPRDWVGFNIEGADQSRGSLPLASNWCLKQPVQWSAGYDPDIEVMLSSCYYR